MQEFPEREGSDDAPRVSVVIPVYNRPEKIERAVQSVTAQSYEDFEVVVVDDASTDETPDVVREIDDPRVRLYVHDRNQNGSAARNTGLRKARGELVAFLDSDDEWLPHCLERQIEVYDRIAPGVDKPVAVFGRLSLQSPSGEVLLPTRGPKSGESIVDYVADGKGMVSVITLLLPREFALEVGFDEGLPSGQDADFACRVAHEGARFEYIDEALAIWHRKSDDHVSGSPDWRPLVASVDRREYLSEEQKRRFLAIQIPPRAARAGERLVAWKYYLLGLRHGIYTTKEILRLAARVALPQSAATKLQRIWTALRHGFDSPNVSG